MADKATRSALLTGVSGYVGSHLARRLIADGWQVHGIVRGETSDKLFPSSLGGVVRHVHDGTTEKMYEIVGAAKPQVVFHLAAMTVVTHAAKDVVPLVESNILLGTQLLDAMAARGVTRLVNTGTSWQHFENRDYSPVDLYAATKQAFEAVLQFYVETTPLRAVTLKLSDTYGPADPRNKVLSFLNRARTESIAMTPGEQQIDLVFIDDVVSAFIAAAALLDERSGAGHESYAVSSGRPLPLKELAQVFARATKSTLDIRWGGRPYRPREVMTPWSKGKPLPGWRPGISLEEGIARATRS